MKDSKIIILFGRSGSGKGTQAKLLIKEFGFSYLGSGDLLRGKASQGGFFGDKLKKVMENGELIPTPIMFQVWSNKIEEMQEEINQKGLIIDGSPRALTEAKLMDSIFDWYQWDNVKVILLDISEQEAFDRLTKRRSCKKCGRLIPWIGELKKIDKCDQCGGELETRLDDKPEAIKSRLEYFKKDVEPAIKYYQKNNRLIRVNGEGTIEDIYEDIKKAL